MNEPGSGKRDSYLMLLARPSTAARSEAARALRSAGITVVAQYDDVALEALATPAEAQVAHDFGMFSAVVKGAMKRDHLERLNDAQRRVVEQWNTRFSARYRRGRTQRESLRGRSWGEDAGDLAAPAPYPVIDPEDFREFAAEYERRTGKRGGGGKSPARKSRGPMSDKDAMALERSLRRKYDDPTLAYHLARLAQRLGPADVEFLKSLDDDFIEELISRFFREADCWRMTGEIAVGIVFVESSRRGGPTFGASERNEICQEIIDGLNWLASEHPGGDLSWIYDLEFVRIDVDDGDASDQNCPNSSALEAGWRDPAMAEVSYQGNTYTANWSSVAEYREDMRSANRAAHAIAIFVTPFANCWHAYASGGRLVLARHNDWGGWGRHTLDTIAAHEVSHLFGAADEYTGSGTPCSTCESMHGCDQIPNGNCGACARPSQDCVMDGNSRRLCPWTRAHIGWAHLFVELTTGDVQWAGTDDSVWLDIGDRSLGLDTPDHDDRERNNRDGYPLWVPTLDCADVLRVMIRKDSDGFAGGWRLQGVRVWCRGELVCDRDEIERWLEDEDRVWVGCTTRSDLVNRLQVKITTADVAWAGTDDDVTVTMAGRDWGLDNPGHDDFERGNTDTFELDPGTGLHLTDLHGIRIHKSPDGFAGGWKLKGVQLLANGSSIFSDQGINRWLEDDLRTWQGVF
jgi:hypothetical protein